ncbi:MAG: carbohydrate-binding domain-containing protein, partial [Erysipelotrichaceae bacterium]|nr:carbohydrate-binding domain-containing protein [Erysipelotrichaceae bacterium]
MIRKLTACLISCLLVLTCFQTAIHADSSPKLTFSETSITETVSGSGYTIDGTSLSITANGVYTIDGTCDEGTLIVEKSLSDVTLIFDSLNLSSSSTAPVVIKKGSTVTIHLEGDSVLSDNEDASTEETNADFEGACIKVKSGSSMTFCGKGSLTVNGNAKNGIKGGSESIIIFNDGTYHVSAANNGIASDHSLTINNGTFDIDTLNDGIKSVPDVDDTVSTGEIIINGGSFEIRSDGDAIQAETLLQINNGDFDIQTMDGYTDTSFDKDTMSAKGIKASGDREDIENLIEINGGTFILNTADDAIHSDTDVTITAGTFDISTQDDGVHADATLNLGTEDGYDRDPDITVNTSYEGLEGGTVNIYSGRFYTVASDDGINAAGGSSSGSGGGWDPWKPGRPGEGASGDYTLNIYGGDVYVNCTGDGLDANGDLNLYGGKITVMSMQQGGDNSPLDSDGTITIKDAEVFAAGTNPMNERPGSGSVYYTSTNRLPAGTVVSVKANNTVYYTEQLVRNVNYILYANPSLSASPSFVSGGSVDPCKSHSWRHAWNEGTLIQEATEESAGLIQYTCASCGETEIQSYRISKDTSCEGHIYEEPDEPVIDEGYPVTFACDENASINIYYTQDYTAPDETGVTSAVSRNSTTGEPDSTGDGQVNFAVVPKEGYVVDTVTVEGSYKNLKTPADTGAENTYRITKVASELNVIVTVKEDDGSGEEPVIDEGYPVTFACDENASINIYYTQDYTAPDETGVTSAVSRNSTTGEPDSTGDGQVNFAVVPKEGYVVDTVTVEGSYKNLKTPADTGAENTYRITKVASELNVIVTVKEKETEEPIKPESVSISADSYELPITETLQLSASVLPADADQNIVWSVSDESVLNIDETGLITALDYGKVTVRAASANNP